MAEVSIAVPSGFKLPAFWGMQPPADNAGWLELVPTLSCTITAGALGPEQRSAKVASEAAAEQVRVTLASVHATELERLRAEHAQELRREAQVAGERLRRELDAQGEARAQEVRQVQRDAATELAAAAQRAVEEVHALRLENARMLAQTEVSRQKETLIEQLQLAGKAQAKHVEELRAENERLAASAPAKALSQQEFGKVAEEEVAEAIREFVPCEVEDVAHGGGHGDRLIHIESSVVKRRMNLFLEVKNCKDVRRDEVDRFLAQVRRDAASDAINAAMFVSLKAGASIPYRMHTSLELIEIPEHNKRVPVLMLHAGSRQAIQSACTSLLKFFEYEAREAMRRACEEHDDVSADFELMKHNLPALVEYVDRQAEALDAQAKALETALGLVHRQKQDLGNVSLASDKMKRHVSFLGDPMDEACRIYVDTRQKKQKTRINLSDVAMTQRPIIARAGGIARVKARVDEMDLVAE